MINDLPGYVSKSPPSAFLSHVLQSPQTAHIAWHRPAGVPSVLLLSAASVFQVGCRIKHSEDQAEPPVAELEKYSQRSEKRAEIIVTRTASNEYPEGTLNTDLRR